MVDRRHEDPSIVEIHDKLECLQGKLSTFKTNVTGTMEQMRLELKHDIKEHIESEDTRLNEMMKVGTTNTELLADLKETIDLLNHNTQPFIGLHKDIKSTMRLGKAVQDFVVWLAKFGAIGLGLTAAAIWVYEHLKPYIK